MKKFTKIVSVLLCFVMAFGFTIPAFAADEAKQDIPIVYVRGQGGSIYDADGKAYGSDVETKDLVKQVLSALADTYITHNYKYAADCLADILASTFPPVDETTGNALEGQHPGNSTFSGKKSNYKMGDYSFVYDWRLDPIYNAELLSAFIDKVMAYTGAEKIALVAFSEGACVCGAYLTYNGADKIDSYTMIAPGSNGIDIVGALAAGKVKFNANTLDKFVSYYIDGVDMMGDDNLEGLIAAVASIFTQVKIMGYGTAFLQDLYNGINKNVSFSEATLGAYAGFWSFVTDEYYDTAMEKNFADKPESAPLVAKIEKYHNEVYKTLPDTLVAMKEAGLKINVIAKYGSASFPIIDDIDIQSDGVIELHNTSFGATSAKLGKTLSKSYLDSADEKYISPDNIIDASTCLFKDSTWFVKGIDHNNNSDSLEAFVTELTKRVAQPVSTGNAFMTYDSKTGEISSDEGSAESPWSGNIFKLLYNLLKKVIGYIVSLLDK